MSKLLKIAAIAKAGFFRAGQFWPHEGRIIDPEVLGEKALKRLIDEPRLHITPASTDAAEEAQADALRDQIKAAIGALEPSDFAEDGTPKAEVVRKALPRGTKGATAALVAEVWAEVKPAD